MNKRIVTSIVISLILLGVGVLIFTPKVRAHFSTTYSRQFDKDSTRLQMFSNRWRVWQKGNQYNRSNTQPTPPIAQPTSSIPLMPTSSPAQPQPTGQIATPTPMMNMGTMNNGGVVSGNIIGSVNPEILGDCSTAVHDRYVTKGPDGNTYRTWHPVTVPVDANNSNGTKCSFAHEHGEDPSHSNIYQGAVPFNYVANQIGMDEPHQGFKCFVANAGQRNDEGRSNLHNSYFCMHMGTGGPARFTEQFHSLEGHVKTNDGRSMDVQVMADTGGVGSICDTPRQGKTVLTLGCTVGSAYEIWENKARITNGNNTIGTFIASTAVFDPITVMDRSDKSKKISVADSIANSIFQFNTGRNGYHGCDREAYHGPMYWTNSSGTTTYMTDAYGKVSANGTLKQQISNSNTGGSYVVTNDGQSQFKLRKNECAPSLGLLN